MKSFIKILFFLMFSCTGLAQDTTIAITPNMRLPAPAVIPLQFLNGWIFRKGNDTAWEKKDIDITGWEKRNPSELSEKLADKNGKLECWLRLKIKLDTTFGNTALDLFVNGWAASDVYVDGVLLNRFGNTGANGKPFKEYNPGSTLPPAFNIEKGNEHLLAIHFVDFISPFPPHHLKSERRLDYFIALALPGFKVATANFNIQYPFYKTIWLSVNVVLCLLFWLLAFQNPAERNLLFIAITSTFFALVVYMNGIVSSSGISYIAFRFSELAFQIVVSLTLISFLSLMLRIFKRTTTLLFKIILLAIFICGLSWLFFPDTPFTPTFEGSLSILVVAYYIITSRKTLRGAQWAILAGILVTIGFGVLITAPGLSSWQEKNRLTLATGLWILFPLSLLIYVSMRFREIIKEVRDNAKRVVQLSEEKKEQALNQQKILQEEVNRQTVELRTSLENLKSTQAQLIQSEKMASLGELTAGIAHEIQNPLNFVNNFSEVNKELLTELKDEIKKGNTDEADAIADDVINNEEKINYHGKRADSIVKGMLQHSRASSGQKELTDINKLADEYLRLSYHGMRARDKSFNAEFKTEFDEGIGKINVVPQDIGRVILNVINNAFYAVNEKKKITDEAYQPTVSIQTKKLNDKVVISVKDDGNGIPQNIVDKIFQPFFTTKPTGQGTGLGLSLAYDIIKAHGGEIKVKTLPAGEAGKEGEGAEFIIQLPNQ